MKIRGKLVKTTGTIRITKRDLRQLDQAIQKWRRRGERAAKDGDQELAQQYATDVEDLTYFRDAAARGDHDTARHAAYDLDTLVRDQIPAAVWDKYFPEN